MAIHRAAGRGCGIVNRLSSVRSRQNSNACHIGEYPRGQRVIDVPRIMHVGRHRVALIAGNWPSQLLRGPEASSCPSGVQELGPIVRDVKS